MKITLTGITQNEFIKRAYFLAYQAAGPEQGMGVFQRRNGATEDEIYHNVCTGGDYLFGAAEEDKTQGETEFYGDYVFGRMLKLGMKTYKGDSVVFLNDDWREDYQAFCTKYPTPKELAQAVVDSLGKGSFIAT